MLQLKPSGSIRAAIHKAFNAIILFENLYSNSDPFAPARTIRPDVLSLFIFVNSILATMLRLYVRNSSKTF